MARKDAILKMREILVLRRDALRKALAGDLSLLKELREQTAGDVVDFALDSAQDEINSQLAEVESRELASIENALERMRTGHFGVCEGCSERIPMARLNALPYATLCIECQRESERYGTSGSGDADWGRLIDNGGGDNELVDQRPGNRRFLISGSPTRKMLGFHGETAVFAHRAETAVFLCLG